MRIGLRLQLLLLLGALLALGFFPLFLATSTYTRIALERQQREAALHVGHSIAALLSQSRSRLSEDALLNEISRQVQSGAVHAIAVYDPAGHAVARAGEPELVDLLPHAPPKSAGAAAEDTSRTLETARGPALVVFAPDAAGGVATVSRVDPVTTKAAALSRMMALYMALGALGLLAFAYLGLTRWIVRPVLGLGHAAERVARGARRLDPMSDAPPELVELSRSLSAMTDRLREEEETLRRKVSELERTSEELQSAQASLVKSERLATVGRLAAGLAHEVGNPLSAVMGLCDLVLDGDPSSSESRDFVHRMKKETGRIHKVITDLLTYARPARRSDHPPAARVPASVATAVGDVTALLLPQRDFQSVRLDVQLESGLPEVALEHAGLVQILLNLVMNAVDAVQGSGRIVIAASRTSEGVAVSVSDDGPGIAPEVQDSLFEPFVTTKDVGQGTGLGLSVSRGLVESVGGSLSLDSSYAGGARFVALLPTAS